MQALLLLFILVYVHIAFARGPSNCLQSVEKDWPRNGILRVEIVRNVPENYTILNSYRKEYHNLRFEELVGGDGGVSEGEGNVTDDRVTAAVDETGETSPLQADDDLMVPDVEEQEWSFSGVEENRTEPSTAEQKKQEKRQNRELLSATLSEFEMLLSVGKTNSCIFVICSSLAFFHHAKMVKREDNALVCVL